MSARVKQSAESYKINNIDIHHPTGYWMAKYSILVWGEFHDYFTYMKWEVTGITAGENKSRLSKVWHFFLIQVSDKKQQQTNKSVDSWQCIHDSKWIKMSQNSITIKNC